METFVSDRVRGFPSSHASFVVALATGAGVERGTADTSFAVAAVLAIVVMYDAMGVRRQAGYHASAINSLISGAYGSNSQNRNSSSGNIGQLSSWRTRKRRRRNRRYLARTGSISS